MCCLVVLPLPPGFLPTLPPSDMFVYSIPVWPCLLLHSLEQDSGGLLVLPKCLAPDISVKRSPGHSKSSSFWRPLCPVRDLYVHLSVSPQSQFHSHGTHALEPEVWSCGCLLSPSFIKDGWVYVFMFHSFKFLFIFLRKGIELEYPYSVIFIWRLSSSFTPCVTILWDIERGWAGRGGWEWAC